MVGDEIALDKDIPGYIGVPVHFTSEPRACDDLI